MSIKVLTHDRDVDRYAVHLGAIKETPSILATVPATPNPSLTIELGTAVLSNLADGSTESTAA